MAEVGPFYKEKNVYREIKAYGVYWDDKILEGQSAELPPVGIGGYRIATFDRYSNNKRILLPNYLPPIHNLVPSPSTNT